MSNGSSTYVLIDVPLDQLEKAPHQPPIRTETTGPTNALQKSIETVGLLYPPLVVRKPDGSGFWLADGHRRKRAVTNMGWKTMPVLVSSGHAPELFSEASGNVRAITANQWIYVFLNGGTVPPGATRVNINRLQETVGREYLERLQAAGMSPQIWSLATQFLKFVELDDSHKQAALWWLLNHKLTQQVRAWISPAVHHDKEPLRAAFLENRRPD